MIDIDRNESSIKNFWQENPCGENLIGKLEDWQKHFANYDEFRYSTEGHILDELDMIDLKEKNVLEIGIGQAADSLQLAKRGAKWNGLDLTQAAVMRAQKRFELNNMEYGEVKQGSATKIPWPDSTFDIVYSHGVLHHIPEIKAVAQDIKRVLKPEGKLLIMMYHRNSLNYYLSIYILRRLGLLFMYFLDACKLVKLKQNSVIGQHVNNAKKIGLWNYLRMRNFIHANTDGPLSPYAKVYDLQDIREDFPGFTIEKSKLYFLNKRHFPGISLLPNYLLNVLEKKCGWHLWVYLTNTK